MYSSKGKHLTESKENLRHDDRIASFMIGKDEIREASSSCPDLILSAKKARKRLTSEVYNSSGVENRRKRLVKKPLHILPLKIVKNCSQLWNDDCEELEILLHKLEYQYLRLQLELEENKSKLVEVVCRDEFLRSQLEIVSSENNFLKTTNVKGCTRCNFVTPRKAKKIIVISEDDEQNDEIQEIRPETAILSVIAPRRSPNVSPTRHAKRINPSPSPCRWENNSLVKINRALEETNVAELRKLLVASIVESEVLLTKLEDAETRRLVILNQAQKSQSDLNDKIARLKTFKHRVKVGDKSELEELELVRMELHSAKARVDRLENEFGAIKLKLDKNEEVIVNRNRDKEQLQSKPERRSSKIKSILHSTFNFVKDIISASVDGDQLDVTPIKSGTDALSICHDVINDSELHSDPFDHGAIFQASTPKRM